MAVTPMMQQYFAVKETVKDCILMYRLGDFYEMFYDDARIASRVLDLVLTGRACGEEERAPMCGVPFHAVDGYIAKLIAAGYRVAVCEQTEDPATAKGIVNREVIRIVTPGTVVDTGYLSEEKNNFICCIHTDGARVGLAFADISTGEMYAKGFESCSEGEMFAELASYSPTEVLCGADIGEKVRDFAENRLGSMITVLDGAEFENTVLSRVSAQFGENWRESSGMGENDPAGVAVGALLGYIERTQKTDLGYISKLMCYSDARVMQLDYYSRRNLELTETIRTKDKKGSLLWAIDRTRTGAGARLLRMWLERPLLECRIIRRRQEAVSYLYGKTVIREDIASELRSTVDIERLLTRVVYNSATPRDMKGLAATLEKIPFFRSKLENCGCEELERIVGTMGDFEKLTADIEDMFVPEPPAAVRDGGFIRDGYDAELDRCRTVCTDGNVWMKELEERERSLTGIKNLRVGYNRVFGYYIEVSKGQISQAPSHYNRLQTLANCERYSIPEMKEREQEMLSGGEKAKAIELMHFSRLRDRLMAAMAQLHHTASMMAQLDVYCSLASIAAENGYIRPEVDDSDVISIRDGRHPVVERFMKDSYFVPNDTELDCKNNRVMIITGPNMAGKSTYMRQVAVLVLLAQIGSFIPAKEARIGIVDRIFTRVGASDDLASGNSTFMLEMVEVASILDNATKKSLIVYDEIGRGTSTYDGRSIARAVVEYTAERIGAKTLFATHYHELTELEGETEGVLNYNIAAKKRGDDIVFLRKILRGPSDESYGIEVAKLAGVPRRVITRARELLDSMPAREHIPAAPVKDGGCEGAISFQDISAASVAEKIRETDLNALTPFEAMAMLYEFKKTLGG